MEGTSELDAKFIHNISNYNGDVLCCAFSGRLLAIGSADKLVRLFVIENDEGQAFTELPQSPLCGHSYQVNFCCFSSLGSHLASCSQDGTLIIWDVRTGRIQSKIVHESGQSIRVCAFSPDSRLIATGSDDETACLWDARSNKLIRHLEGHEDSVVALAFSPDTNYVVTGTSLGDVRVMDARFGLGRHLALHKQAHDLGVTCAQFSPSFGNESKGELNPCNSYLLATGGLDNAVRLWRLETSNDSIEPKLSAYTVLEGHSQNVMCLAFSPNGSKLASGVIIWDPIRGTNLLQLTYHQRYVTCVAFSSDGSLLASGSNDKHIAIWKFTSAEKGGTGAEGKKDVANVFPKVCAKRLSDWKIDDVQNWLTSIRMQQYASVFAHNLIDGQELSHLSDSMLKNSLNIDALGHRNRILRSIKDIKEGEGNKTGPMHGHLTVCQSVPGVVKPEPNPDSPHEFYCPITHELMSDPVIAADGYTYERSAMSLWIEGGKRTSPMTNAPLVNLELTPNRMLKMLINKSK